MNHWVGKVSLDTEQFEFYSDAAMTLGAFLEVLYRAPGIAPNGSRTVARAPRSPISYCVFFSADGICSWDALACESPEVFQLPRRTAVYLAASDSAIFYLKQNKSQFVKLVDRLKICTRGILRHL